MPYGEAAGNWLPSFLNQTDGYLDGRIHPSKLDKRGGHDLFNKTLLATGAQGAGAATGTTGDTNALQTGSGTYLYHIKGTQTIVCPIMTTAGLDISLDQTDNDGAEYVPGILADSRRQGCFKVGTDTAFFTRFKIKIADVSGTDDLCLGFRKAEAFQAAVDNYDEGAWVNVILGDIYTEKILNNAATVATDSTLNWADGETKTVEVQVSLAGVVTFYVDGVLLSTAVAMTFDAAELVIPMIYFLQATTSPGVVTLLEWTYGLIVAE